MPLGASTQLEGVPADIVLPSILEELEIGEKYQDYALDFSRVTAAKVKDYKMVGALVEPLKVATQSRITQNKKFVEIQDEITKYKASKLERSRVSLKEGADQTSEEEKQETEALAERQKKDPEVERVELLNRDAYLQEALLIASDYQSLLQKQPTPISYELPDVKEEAKIAEKAPEPGLGKDKQPKAKDTLEKTVEKAVEKSVGSDEPASKASKPN
jgi:carboxyl-terminal processing protease